MKRVAPRNDKRGASGIQEHNFKGGEKTIWVNCEADLWTRKSQYNVPVPGASLECQTAPLATVPVQGAGAMFYFD